MSGLKSWPTSARKTDHQAKSFLPKKTYTSAEADVNTYQQARSVKVL
jgi:hypothetical protein